MQARAHCRPCHSRQAGIHPRLGLGAIGEMDPRLRGDDNLSLT